ncbi:hypothetical protein RB195_003530 [Necator americanus]|uniref:Endonuclease/exonuclease/phosphatase domain-containing protein n=1 Tax=Necator americanus TaxID=51031 RepID=A0ABR1DNZ2_NECAM
MRLRTTAEDVNSGSLSAHAPTKTAEDNSKDAFYDELNALMSKIPSQQVVIVGIDANAKTGLEQQSDVQGKCKRKFRLLTPEEQRKRKMRTLKLRLEYVLTVSVSQSDIQKSKAVRSVAFDSDHRPLLLSFTAPQEKPRNSSSTEN